MANSASVCFLVPVHTIFPDPKINPAQRGLFCRRITAANVDRLYSPRAALARIRMAIRAPMSAVNTMLSKKIGEAGFTPGMVAFPSGGGNSEVNFDRDANA